MTIDSIFKVVVPARYASSRLPGKPLKEIAGKPMIQLVWENAKESGATEVVVATDDSRIADAVTSFGGTAMMTSASHKSGTDRINEVAEKLQWSDDDVVVNLQGDEPAIGVDLIQMVAGRLIADSSLGMSTLATPITTASDLFDPNVVKVVLDQSDNALYFSRAPIPWERDLFAAQTPETVTLDGNCNTQFLRHLGLYAYRVCALRRISAAPQDDNEKAESLEQLRAMGLGIKINVFTVDEAPGHGVDTMDDLLRVQRTLETQ